MTKEEIESSDPGGYEKWLETGMQARCPGGDSRGEFYNRIMKAALDVLDSAELPILAVLHKGVIRGILSALLDKAPNELTGHRIELGSIHRLEKSSGKWELIGSNETGHLGEYRKIKS